MNAAVGTNERVDKDFAANAIGGAMGGTMQAGPAALNAARGPDASLVRARDIVLDDRASMADRMAAMMELSARGYTVDETGVRPADPNAEPMAGAQPQAPVGAVASEMRTDSPVQLERQGESATPQQMADAVIAANAEPPPEPPVEQFSMSELFAAPELYPGIDAIGQPAAEPATEIAQNAQAPSSLGGLFAPPTQQEIVQGAARDADARRNGDTGQVIPGVGGLPLFAGDAPVQARVPDGSPPEVNVDRELLQTAREDLAGADGVFVSDIARDQQGVIPGALTSLNRSLIPSKFAPASYTVKEIAKPWERTRELLRKRHGDRVTLYRADAPEAERNADTRLVYMGDRGLAEKFAVDGRKAEPFTVAVDDIVAVNVTPSGYYEFIVDIKPDVQESVQQGDDYLPPLEPVGETAPLPDVSPIDIPEPGKRPRLPTGRLDTKGRPIRKPGWNPVSDGLVEWLAAGEGVNFEQLKSYAGVDPALLKDQSVMNPLGSVGMSALRRSVVDKKTGKVIEVRGMTLDRLLEAMQGEGWLPQEDPNAPPQYGISDAVNMVMAALNGEKIYHPTEGLEERQAQELLVRENEDRGFVRDQLEEIERAQADEAAFRERARIVAGIEIAVEDIAEAMALYDSIINEEAADGAERAAEGSNREDGAEGPRDDAGGEAAAVAEDASPEGAAGRDEAVEDDYEGVEPQLAAYWRAIDASGVYDKSGRAYVDAVMAAMGYTPEEVKRKFPGYPGGAAMATANSITSGTPISTQFFPAAPSPLFKQYEAMDTREKLPPPKKQARAQEPAVDAEQDADEDIVESRAARAPTGDDIDAMDAELDALGDSEDGDGAYEMAQADAENERVEVRRLRKRKSTKKPPKITSTRDEAVLAYSLEIFTDNGYDEDFVANMPPKEQLGLAADILKSTFGYREVTVANDLNTIEGLNQLKFAYANLHSMAAVMGWPPATFGRINPILKFARSADGALAYYMPSTAEIVVSRQNDAYAHEFGHAIDFWTWTAMGAIDPSTGTPKGRGATGKLKRGAGLMPADINEAYAQVLDVMYRGKGDAAFKIAALEKNILVIHKQIADLKRKRDRALDDDRIKKIDEAIAKREAHITRLSAQISAIKAKPKAEYTADSDYYLNARLIDKGQGTAVDPGDGEQYWQRPTEMFARAFEAYTAWKIERAGGSTEFLARTDAGYMQTSVDFIAKAYPQELERERIFQAIDDLTHALRDHMTGGLTGEAPGVRAPDPLAPAAWRNWTPQTVAPANFLAAIKHAHAEASAQREDGAERKAIANQLAGRTRAARGAVEGSVKDARLRAHDLQINVRRGWAAGIGGWLLSMEGRYPGSSGFATISRIFTTSPGSGRLRGQTYEEFLQAQRNKWAAELGKIVTKHDLNSLSAWTKTEKRLLRDALVDHRGVVGRGARYSTKVIRAAEDLRRFHDELYMFLTNAGVELGYAKNGYLQRIVDAERVMLDPKGFVEKATVVYREVFERDVGTGQSTKMDAFKQYAIELLGKNDPEVRELRKLMKAITEKRASGADVSAELDALQDLLDEGLYERVQDAFADAAAKDWQARILGTVADEDFSVQGASGRFMKSRVLPESSDLTMGDFMVTDPLSLAATYMASAVNRVAFEKFIPGEGAAAGRIEALGATLRAEGVLASDVEEALSAVKLMTGLYRPNITKAGLRFRSGLIALTAPVVLGRALASQLVEPFVVAHRTGNPLDIPAAYASQLRDFALWMPGVAQLFDTLTRGNKKRKAEMVRELASFLGVVSDVQFDQIMNNRENTLYANKAAGQMLAGFYRYTGIHGHTMSMRRAAVERSTYYLKRIAAKALKGNKRAIRDLADVGIDASDRALVTYLAQTMPMVPSVAELQASPHAAQLSTAINRFVDEVVMNPKVVDKPRLASTAEWSYMYGVLSYTAAFTHNVIFRHKERIEQAWEQDGKMQGGLVAAWAGGLLGLSLAGQAFQLLLRAQLFGGGAEDELEKWQKDPGLAFGTLMSRSGFTGMADPFVNSMLGLKYRRSPAEVAAGAYYGFWLQAFGKFGIATVQDSPNTNTAERSQVKAAWEIGVAPLIAATVLRRAPWLAPALMWSSSPMVKDKVADVLVGPKQERGKSSVKGTDNDRQTRQNSRQDDRTGGPVSD
jgi:hypothetical protein